MGKTFRRNEGRRPKWNKRGKKPHKIREFEDERHKKPTHYLPPLPPDEDDEMT